MNPEETQWPGWYRAASQEQAYRQAFRDFRFTFTREGFKTAPPPKPVLLSIVIDGERVEVPMERDELDELLRRGRAHAEQQRLRDEQERRRREQWRRQVSHPSRREGFTSTAEAITYLRETANGDTTVDMKKLVTRAKRRAHPDTGGSNEAFRLVTAAEALLRGAGRI